MIHDPARKRALEWLAEVAECGDDCPHHRGDDVYATIEAALKAPQLSDEQWDEVEDLCRLEASSTSSKEQQSFVIDIATTIRASRGEP